MFRLLLLISILVGFLSSGYGQISYFTYYEGCVLREKPTVNSNIIMSLPIKTPLHSFDGSNGFSLYDTINNQPGSWVNIEYKGHSGYIWEHLISDNSFTTHQGELVLLKTNKEQDLEYKIFYGDSLLVHIKDSVYKGDFKHKTIQDGSGLLDLNAFYFVLHQGSILTFKIKNHRLEFDTPEHFNSKPLSEAFVKDTTNRIGLAFGNDINIRLEPNKDAPILGQLYDNQIVDIDSVGQFTRIDKTWGKWVCISFNNKRGYVWDSFLIVQDQVYIQKETDLKFFLSYRKIAAIDQENKVISDFTLTKETTGNNFIWIKDEHSYIKSSPFQSSKNGDAIIKIYLGHGEMDVRGEYTDCILWNGQEFKKLYTEYGSSEMGYFYSEKYTYVNKIKNLKYKDLMLKMDSELSEFEDDDYDTYKRYLGITTWAVYKRMGLYTFKNDTLLKINSRIDILENKLQESFGEIQIKNYKYLDFNGDGLLDILFFAQKAIKNTNHSFVSKSKDFLGYAITINDTLFNIVQVNNHIFNSSHATEIRLGKNGFHVWNSSWKFEEENSYYPSFIKLKFTYNSKEDRFYLKSKKMNWEKTMHYNKQPVLLENAW